MACDYVSVPCSIFDCFKLQQVWANLVVLGAQLSTNSGWVGIVGSSTHPYSLALMLEIIMESAGFHALHFQAKLHL
jgi:hypothetical protein